MARPTKSQWDFGELFPTEQTRQVLSVSELTEQVRRLLEKQGAALPRLTFHHGACYRLEPPLPALVASYHPSRQNTNTGRLTRPMWHAVFRRARTLVDGEVARLTLTETHFGHLFDIVTDNLVHMAVFVGLVMAASLLLRGR